MRNLASFSLVSLLLRQSWSNERKLLGPHYEGRLVAVDTDLAINVGGSPLILVHGSKGSAQNFTSLLQQVPKLQNYTLFYFAYDDLHRSLKRSALELAEQIISLHSSQVTIVAHSTGGLIAREALNILAQLRPPEFLPEVHVIAVDCPWHGGSSKGCSIKGSRLDRLVEAFMPAAKVDLRTCSEFFDQLYQTPWPERFSMTLFFAKESDQAWDYMEGPLKAIPRKIANYISKEKEVTGSLAEINFWKALRSSSQYSYFEVSLKSLHDKGPLTPQLVIEDLQTYFPRLPGDHFSVLQGHPESASDLPRYLEEIL